MAPLRTSTARSVIGICCAVAAVAMLGAMAAPIRPTSDYEAASLRLVNTHRAGNGLPALSASPTLRRLAGEHSERMARGGALSHEGFKSRFERSGFTTCVENIARNFRTPEDLVAGWTRSKGHKANMLNPRVTHAAIGQSGIYATFLACG